VQQVPGAPAVFGYGDCITWPFKTPDWLPRVLVQSLIALIPFVGSMALIGWLLTAADRLFEDDHTVPPAGFYLRRGARVYFVAFIWALVSSAILYTILFGFMAGFMHPMATGTSTFFFLFGGWFVFVLGIGLVTHLVFLFFVPGAVEADARGAIRGLNPVHAVADVFHHPKDSLLAALISYVAWIIAGIGASLCYVGILITLGYGALVFAGALYVYERNTAARTA
jgi:hypothetical protein